MEKIEGIQILYEDEFYISLNKPPMVLSIPDRFDKNKISLSAILEKRFGKIFIVHRLDKETSGVIVFAKTPEAHKNLSIQFENHQVEKKYLAVVEGIPKTENGEINFSIEESRNLKGVMVISKNGKESLTKFQVIEKFKHFSLVEFQPKTGRMHQIRIHTSSFGNPIVADSLYGSGTGFFLSSIKRNFRNKNGESENAIISRAALHAKNILFENLFCNQKTEISADLPKDFKALLNTLKKYDS